MFGNLENLKDEINRLETAYKLLEEVYYSTGPYNQPFKDKIGNVNAIDPKVMSKIDDFFGFDDSE